MRLSAELLDDRRSNVDGCGRADRRAARKRAIRWHTLPSNALQHPSMPNCG